METDFAKQLSMKRKLDEDKNKEYKRASKERLLKIVTTKIRTTMIGALESIEKRLAKLWDTEEKLTNEQLILKSLYEEMRQEILDRGNQQIRNVEKEFEQYEVDWKRYTLVLPVKNKD